MKKIISILTVLLLLLALCCPVFADAPLLSDRADLISAENETKILSYLQQESDRLDFTFAVLTEDSIGGGDIQDYADVYYEDNFGMTTDGILFVLVMDTREWAFSTTGLGQSIFGDSDLDDLITGMLPYLRDGDYANAVAQYASVAVNTVDYAKTYGYNFNEYGYDTYDSGVPYEGTRTTPLSTRVGVGGFIGALAGLISVLVMKSGMNTAHKNKTANDYIRQNSFSLKGKRDLFLNSSVVATLRSQDSARSSGSSHHGGGSIHISSGGGSHGGSHGHF